MPVDTVADIWAVLQRYDGVPRWWAEVFANIGFSAGDAETWVATAASDPRSVLTAICEKELNMTLKPYAAARGISLMGSGDGDSELTPMADKLIHNVSTVVTVAEQEAIIAEVSGYADVRFREKLNGIYTGHGVANAVRGVHQAYLNKSVARGLTRLEAGASVKQAVLAGVDVTKHHCCAPVLCVRDSVRHSLGGWLRSVADPASGYKAEIRAAAEAALDESSGFVCRSKVEDCTRQVDVICSNESTHDIMFDDLPKIMSRHGARTWVGFMTRAPGVTRVGGPNQGKCKVFGTRWKVDRKKDTINFHFNRDGSFSYEHRFSEWIKYEEFFGFRWYGKYYDYVYSRLPITTQASLAFVVSRVPKAPVLLPEPVYKSAPHTGMVKVTSIRAVGGCVGARKTRFEPTEFYIERLLFDRVLESRVSQGTTGNLATTLSYMKSARLKLAVNGTALATVAHVPSELLEPMAVAVEVLASDGRRAGERDYEAIMEASAESGAYVRVLRYFSGLGAIGRKGRQTVIDTLKSALASLLNGVKPCVIKVEDCPEYVVVSDGSRGGYTTEDAMRGHVEDCVCKELTTVEAALKAGTMVSRGSRRELERYAQELRSQAAACVQHSSEWVDDAEAEDCFFDCEEVTEESAVSATVVESMDGDTKSSVTAPSSVSDVCDDLTSDGEVGAGDVSDGELVKSVREYATWVLQADKCVRTEAALNYDVLFHLGTPTEADVQRFTTARTRHAVVSVVDGRVTGCVGGLRPEDDYSEVYVKSLGRTCKVHTSKSGRKTISESVTELCYTSSDMCVMNGDELCREALRQLQDLPRGFSFPRFVFVNAVPGGGKTYEIKERMKEDIRNGKSVMYLTQTKASSVAVERDLRAEFGESVGVQKTFDSFLIHGATPAGKGSVDTLYMDEVPMAHKGGVFSSMLKVRAQEVRAYGDTFQIPCMSFMADFDFSHSKFVDAEITIVKGKITHRFGRRICAMWLDVYGEIFPCECHEHDDDIPQVIEIAGVTDVPALPTGKLLTFTQDERSIVKREMNLLSSVDVLKASDEGGLSTVGEDQGGTHLDVSIVRVASKRNLKESIHAPSIYNKQPWVLVATTRHRRRLRYYTIKADDLVRARIELAVCPVRLKAVDERRPWASIAGTAMQVRSVV